MQHTILAVDDDLEVLGMTKQLLEVFGYKVLTANCGPEAMQIWRDHRGSIDLLFTDVFMPEMNGVELAGALSALQPGLKVVFTSGSERERVDELFSSPEEMRLLKKPASPEHLAECVRQAIAGE